MSTQAIERNYRKNPHTARFLMAFHAGGQGLPVDIEDDLLDSVKEIENVDLRSPGQARIMEDLIGQIIALDEATGAQARAYTDGMTEHGRWTPGREGNASDWIGRMIARIKVLRETSRRTAAAAPEVADGRYAVEQDGTLKFFRVKNGRRAGMVFLDIQASDDWHAIRNLAKIREVLTLIAADPKAAMVRYGHELGECGRCGRTLTDEASRAAGIGPVCADK